MGSYRLEYRRLAADRHEWRAYTPDGTDAAVLQGEVHPEGIVLHNRVFLWGPVTAREMKRLFAEIRGMIRAMGITLMMPATDKPLPTRIVAWWRYMGFDFVTEQTDEHGRVVTMAVMEA